MAQLHGAYDASQYDPTQRSGGNLPVGKHLVQIIESDVKATKSGDSGKLELIVQVIDGDARNQTGLINLNLYNVNPEAARIAHDQLSAICHVTGVMQITDSQQLHNIPFMVEAVPQKNEPKYTEVKKVYDRDGNEPVPGKPYSGGGNNNGGSWGSGDNNNNGNNNGNGDNNGGSWGNNSDNGNNNGGSNTGNGGGASWGNNSGGNSNGPSWGS